MKRTLTLIAQVLVVIVGLAVLAFLLIEPTREGVNVGASFSQIYFHDPLLAYAYVASIPFFVALWKAFRVFGYAGRGGLSSPATRDASMNALRVIKRCMVITVIALVIGEAAIIIHGAEEFPPLIFMGLLICAGAGIIFSAADRTERFLRAKLAS
jgi:hypothetical protein